MALTAMLACLLLQNAWVVDDDGGPGVNFTDIPPAIAAAADGDILLVQPGTYSHFTLSGKGLRILGSGASDTIVTNLNPALAGGTLVEAVPASSVAYVEKLRFAGGCTSVAVTGAQTRATFADAEILGGIPLCSGFALDVGGALVEVVRSVIQGRQTITIGCGFLPTACPGGPGLRALNGARVHVTSSIVSGGDGGLPTTGSVPGGYGGIGVDCDSSDVWIADSIVRGGDAGCTFFGGCGVAGAGIRATGNGFVRVSGDSTSFVSGGSPAGAAIVTFCSPCNPMVVVHTVPVLTAVSGGGITLTAPPLPVLRVSGVLTLTGSATITLSNGLPNAAYVIAFAAAPGFVPGGSFFLGEILLDPSNWYLLAIGSLTPAGDVALTLPLGAIPPGFVYLPVYLQGLAFDPGGLWRMSNSTVATIRP